MQRNFAVSVVQACALVAIALLLLYRTVQTDHFETLQLETRREVTALAESLADLREGLGDGTIAVTGAAGAAPAAGTGNYWTRYFTAEGFARVTAPGNLLTTPAEHRRREGGADGGTIRRAFMADVPGMNPLTQNAADVSELYHYVAETLGARDRDNPDQFNVELAERIEVNADYTEYHVWLKPGVAWHPPAVDLSSPEFAWLDGDHEVVADDFVFFLELVMNTQVEAAHLRNYYEKCSGIEVVNDHEFIVRWTEPQYQSLEFTIGLQPIPRWLYGHDRDGRAFDPSELGRQFNSHWYNNMAIGTGPYRFVSWEQGGSIRLERFDGYHAEKPYIEEIEFRVIADASTRLNGLRGGELDYVPLQQTQYNQEVLGGGTPGFQEGGNLRYSTFQGTTYRYIGWNMDGQLFGDRRVRLAMTHAMNREQLLAENFFGLGRLVTGHVFIDSSDYNTTIQPWPFDLNRAAELLAEAGWEDTDGDGIRDRMIDGAKVNFEFSMLTYGHRPEFIAAMEAYKNDLRRIGVVMNVLPVEWSVMIDRMNEKDFDAYTGGWQLAWTNDPYQIWHSSQADEPQGSNRVGFRNPEADRIIEELRRTFDTEARRTMLWRFHEILHEEQPYTFFFAPLEIGSWSERLQGVEHSPIRPFDSNIAWWLSQAAQ